MIIYVLCPHMVLSGGPELLHQLVFYLNSSGVESYITYYGYKPERGVPVEYSHYADDFIVFPNINDSEENIVVIPEIRSYFIKDIRNAKKVFWWMSVDNYFLSQCLRLDIIKLGIIKGIHKWIQRKCMVVFDGSPRYLPLRKFPNDIIHLVQSEYAAEFLRKNHIYDFLFLTDYINDDFFSYPRYSEKENVVVYNPRKGKRFTERLIRYCPDITFIPLENLSRKEMIATISKAKVYIDFGNHPGKDRIPREAAVLGCCIITGKRGSASNCIDVPIPSAYKFDQSIFSLRKIKNTLERCLFHYDECIGDFDGYVSIIKSEKTEFIKQIEQFVQTIN